MAAGCEDNEQLRTSKRVRPSSATALQKSAVAALDYLKSLQKAVFPAHGRTARKVELSGTVCFHCGREFSRKCMLFSHIKKEGHALLTVRPPDAIAFSDASHEDEAMHFLRTLLEGELGFGAELPEHFIKKNSSSVGVRTSTLSAYLDSGESMATVITARLLICPMRSESRKFLLRLLARFTGRENSGGDDYSGSGGEHMERSSIQAAQEMQHLEEAIWHKAKDFEIISIVGGSVSAGVVIDTPAGGMQRDLAYRPRKMWNLPDVSDNLSAIQLARTTVEEDRKPSNLLKTLLPLTFPFEQDCITCLDKTFMCCGVGGAVRVVEGCGCITCPESMSTWINTQVHSDQKGSGEVQCVGCPQVLSQAQLEAFCPSAAPLAERRTLEKALVRMGDWHWCAAGCGSGGFSTGVGLNRKCKTIHCPTCDVGSCVECGLFGTQHTSPSGQWISCAAARRQQDSIEATEEYLRTSTKRCPRGEGGCGALTLRDGGCSHITCRVCNFQWCWLCEGKYKGKYTMGNTCPCPKT